MATGSMESIELMVSVPVELQLTLWEKVVITGYVCWWLFVLCEALNNISPVLIMAVLLLLQAVGFRLMTMSDSVQEGLTKQW